VLLDIGVNCVADFGGLGVEAAKLKQFGQSNGTRRRKPGAIACILRLVPRVTSHQLDVTVAVYLRRVHVHIPEVCESEPLALDIRLFQVEKLAPYLEFIVARVAVPLVWWKGDGTVGKGLESSFVQALHLTTRAHASDSSTMLLRRSASSHP